MQGRIIQSKGMEQISILGEASNYIKFCQHSKYIEFATDLLKLVQGCQHLVISIWIPRSDKYHMKIWAKQGQILYLQPFGFYKNMPRNQGENMVHLSHLSQIIFPDFPWLSTEILKFPDFPDRKLFPWFSLTLATLLY